MANINLLPQEMRERERREMQRAARQPKTTTITMSSVPAGRVLPVTKPIKPKKSWLGGLFGKKTQTPMSSPVKPLNATPSVDVDLLKSSKKQNIRFEQMPKIKPIGKNVSLWARILGVPASPIKDLKMEPPKPAPVMSSAPAKPRSAEKFEYQYSKPQPEPKIKPEKIKKPRVGFWASLGFGRHKKMIVKSKPDLMPPVAVPPTHHKKSAKAKKPTKTAGADFINDTPNINLVPEELISVKYIKTSQQILGIVLAIGISALIIGGGYFGLGLWQNKMNAQVAQLKNQQEKITKDIASYGTTYKEEIRMQDKILVIKKLLSKHNYWTKFFSLLERYTLDDVYYTDFTASVFGEFVLPAVALASNGNNVEEKVAFSYEKAAQQIVALEKAASFVKGISVDALETFSGEAGFEGVKFDIRINLIDGVFNNPF